MTTHGIRRITSWLVLILLSTGAAALMYQLQLPAAFMLGPMIAAILVALSGAGLRLQRNFSLGAQSVMGCLIAGFITPSLLAAYTDHWLALTTTNIATMAIIVIVSVIIARCRWLPNTTAIWGLFPGAASAMVLLADTHHSDPRVVAMMQYSRIVLVSVASISMASVLDQAHGTGESASGPSGLAWSLSTEYGPILAGLGLALCGYAVAKLTGNGALALLFPAFGGTALQAAGLIRIEVPSFIFIPAFTITGWYVGLMFTRSALRHCLALLPIMLSAIAVVILVCGLLALVLARMIPDIGLLTAYLALSPGGIETIVIIARDADVFLPLILASQFLRLLMVLSIGPGVARAVAGWQSRHQSAGS
ncbi:AbrB family transcriptional regulator [Pseudomonas stutzeri]|uniref:AbrB family transcriptional regulator n=1 Tax=Stutzerimonas stutzeri TaxID=316 RepID=UPI001F527EA0|nr:AbrB family transcriptional regulator [Stutzerimonas stutzeri]MCI0916648.1 AbrB family transcriptional regulator [Stutzerimonas stutzeri]